LPTPPTQPQVIHASAPIRICDCGGWTDTWFARHGRIFNIAVTPRVNVDIKIDPDPQRSGGVILDVCNYGDRYRWQPGPPWGPHPLLEAALTLIGMPPDLACEISIFSSAPSGASTGTSAAVTVALIGALALLMEQPMSPQKVARAAHQVETELLSQQCGIQDQLASALGGINLIEMDEYPHAMVTPVPCSQQAWEQLEQRLALVYLGKSHRSSDVHQIVIQGLENSGAADPALEALRQTALQSAAALSRADLPALGAAMVENTAAQARLHPALVSQDARQVIAIAREHGALRWKVNGAGGEGGSLTLLGSGDANAQRIMLQAICLANPQCKVIPITISREGLQTWQESI
jgi:D-glycero-alpha-D-manno-heptose-7-phosphate kinase